MKSKAMALLILMSIVCFSGMHEDIDGQSQAAKRAISERDLFDFVWIGDPQISPDGSQVVFYRVAPNQQRTDYDGAIWMVPTSGNSSPAALKFGRSRADGVGHAGRKPPSALTPVPRAPPALRGTGAALTRSQRTAVRACARKKGADA